MKWSRIEPTIVTLWGVMLFLLVLNRALSTVAMFILGLTIIISQFLKEKPRISWSIWSYGIILLIALFIIYGLGYFRFIDHPEAWPRFEKKSPLILIPLMWILSRLSWKKVRFKIYLWLTSAILIGGLVMLVGSSLAFIDSGNWNEYSYHLFTSHIQISAIYYSLFIVCVLAIAPTSSDLPISKTMDQIIRGSLVVLLLLSASKLFVFIGLSIVCIRWFRTRNTMKVGWKQVAIGLVIGLLSIPVIIRTVSLSNSNLEIVTQDQYNYDTPINGLTLRLIQARFGLEVLNQENAWLLGVGPAMNKSKLDNRYKAHNMYTGNPELGDRGMLAYNYHNQWMETLTAIGLPGFFLLILVFAGLIVVANFYRVDTSIIIVFAIFMFTESFLERQQGVVLFAFVASIFFKPEPID